MQRMAAIDIGTNSTRLLIAELCQSGKLNTICSELVITRLGEDVDRSRELNEQAIGRTIETLSEYQMLLEQHKVSEVRVVATSAVRDVKNKKQFIELVKKKSGLKVEVITGAEEAQLSYLGVVKALPNLLADSNLILDIGGGSTEFILGSRQKIKEKFSLDLGAVRMTEQSSVLSQREDLIKEILDMKLTKLKGQVKTLFGVGGTITTLAAIEQGLFPYQPEKVHGYLLDLETIEGIFLNLAGKSIEERKEVVGLQDQRADIIVAGVQILLVIMEELNLKEIIVSESDILEGIIYKSIFS